MSRTYAIAAAAGLVLLAIAADWPQFRGPNRDGISAERGLRSPWAEDGPPELWRRPLGEGYSGISVVDGRLYTMFSRGGEEHVVCLDAETGEEAWSRRIDEAWKDNWGNGPRSTPTVHDGVVYALSANATLAALDAAGGTVRFMRDLKKDFGARIPQWGASASALIVDGKLLLNVGGKSGASIVAFSPDDGQEIWRAQNDKPGYSAPIVITVGGVRQVVFFTGTRLTSLTPDGKTLWSVEWETSYDVNASTPVFVAPDKLFVSTGYDVGAALFRIVEEKGKLSTEELWKTRGMRNKFSSSVYHGGYLYGFDEKNLTCLDARTGKMQWRERGLGHGSLFIADGHLVVLGDEGTLVLAEATSEGYRERGRKQVFDARTWTVPTLADGRLYVRSQKHIVALDVAQDRSEEGR